jgi:glycine/D-amino acid oxidase-like deaminating enzyme
MPQIVSTNMQASETTDTVVIGAGSIGLAVAYYLAVRHGITRIVVLDPGEPMAMTSAQSGENYRNWWPHPVMTAFTDHATDLLEDIARDSANRINMTRRGYLLATRNAAPDDLIADLHRGYGDAGDGRIRIYTGAAAGYQPPASSDWQTAPDGVDVLMRRADIAAQFPSLAPDIQTIVHIRRAGDISGQQLGQFMLERMRAAGVQLRRAAVTAIDAGPHFTLHLDGGGVLHADRVVNAAGPFFTKVAAMLGEDLPVRCVFQQKIAFEDRAGALPRTLPFTIDLDGQALEWTEEERAILASEPESARLLQPLPGGIHRRPEGGEFGRWVKLGWAYNATPSDPAGEPPVDPNFPDIVLRAASRLSPALKCYLGNLPRGARHYGGYYAMTDENWPLIGPMRRPGAFMAGALSGFGTMAATATGALCAAWVADAERPAYAPNFTLARYDNMALMAELRGSGRGVL